jgi:FdhD protein
VSEVFIRRPTTSVRVRALDCGQVIERPDRLVTEEPMEIRVHGPGQEPMPLAVTMRTPGADFELAVGFCITEGIVAAPADVMAVAYCLEGGEQRYNVVTVRLREPVSLEGRERHFAANASCGLCGKAALDQIELECVTLDDELRVPGSMVLGLPGRLRDAQHVFDLTGGLHAAALFDPSGELVALREDVGRHNALDKLIGAMEHGQIDPAAGFAVITSRCSFEMVQKAATIRIPILVAISASTTMALRIAEQTGITLVALARSDSVTVYANPGRIRGLADG